MSKSSKMLEIMIGFFAVVLSAAFNALVIAYMTEVTPIQQFQSFSNIIESSEYDLFPVNGSLLHAIYTVRSSKSAIVDQCVA